MLKWVKSLFGSTRGYEEGYTVLPEVHNIPRMPKVKPPKGSDISEPVISFLETVRKNPKRFKVGVDCSSYTVRSVEEKPDYKAYKIWDNKLEKGWYVRGSRWIASSVFLLEHINPLLCVYEDAFFITPDEKEYLIKEISSIMNYRIDRKAKLDKIRADRRIRDTRNKLKELYK
jgi:hypothetical protein